MENNLLNIVYSDRTAYEEIKQLVSEEDFSTFGWQLWNMFHNYYEKDSKATRIDYNTVLGFIEIQYPKHYEIFKQVLDGFGILSIPNIVELLKLQKKNILKSKLAAAFAGGDENVIADLLNQYTNFEEVFEEEAEEDNVYYGDNVIDIVENAYNIDNLLRLHPDTINKRINGGAFPENHILIFGRPNAAKTLAALNFSAGFVHPDQNRKVLYFSNEDASSQILMRYLCRMSGWDQVTVKNDPRAAQIRANRAGGSNFILYDLNPGDLNQIDRVVNKYKPEVIIVDQMRNLTVKNAGNTVEQLERAAVGVRNIAKKYKILAISITQAGNEAEGQLELKQGHVYNSNTGIPGAVDLMIGIGVNDQLERENRRAISTPKNKLSGINTGIDFVTIDPVRSIMEDIA